MLPNMRRVRIAHALGALSLVATLTAPPLAAQRLPPALPLVHAPTYAQRPVAPPDDPSGATLGALVGGATGLLGATAFVMIGSHCSECDSGPLVFAAYLGLPVGASLGAYIGNSRRGSYEIDLLATGLASLAGYEVTKGSSNGMVFLGSMLGQVITAAVVERVTGEGRAPRDSLTGQAR